MASPRCFAMLITMPEMKPSATSNAERAERAAVDAFEPFEAGKLQTVGGRAGVFQWVTLRQVHQAGEEADADGDGAGMSMRPWSMPQNVERLSGSERFGTGPVGAEMRPERDWEQHDAGGTAGQVEERGEVDDCDQPGGPEEPVGG